MKRKHIRFGLGFRVALGNARSQAAHMTLAPGESEGGEDNRHRGADQWLFVVAGTGEVLVNRKKFPIKAGDLVLIRRGDTHTIHNTGANLLRTLNIYVPPAYSADGEELPPAKK